MQISYMCDRVCGTNCTRYMQVRFHGNYAVDVHMYICFCCFFLSVYTLNRVSNRPLYNLSEFTKTDKYRHVHPTKLTYVFHTVSFGYFEMKKTKTNITKGVCLKTQLSKQ